MSLPPSSVAAHGHEGEDNTAAASVSGEGAMMSWRVGSVASCRCSSSDGVVGPRERLAIVKGVVGDLAVLVVPMTPPHADLEEEEEDEERRSTFSLRVSVAELRAPPGPTLDPLVWRADPTRPHALRRRRDRALGLVFPIWKRLENDRPDFLMLRWPRSRTMYLDPTRDWRPDLWTVETSSAVARVISGHHRPRPRPSRVEQNPSALLRPADVAAATAPPEGGEVVLGQRQQGLCRSSISFHRRRRLPPPSFSSSARLECPICFRGMFGTGAENDEDDDECATTDQYPPVARLPCGHVECEGCVLRGARGSRASGLGPCPQCRATTRSYVRLFAHVSAARSR